MRRELAELGLEVQKFVKVYKGYDSMSQLLPLKI